MRFIIMANALVALRTASAHAAPKLTYVACRAMVIGSPVYLGGKESSLACERPCEAAIQRCIENGGRFW
jgi:hypothetical protein